jgi:hypothetical protein
MYSSCTLMCLKMYLKIITLFGKSVFFRFMYPYKSRGCNNLLKAKNVYASCKGNDKNQGQD